MDKKNCSFRNYANLDAYFVYQACVLTFSFKLIYGICTTCRSKAAWNIFCLINLV